MPGTTVVVIGAGGLGQYAVQLLRELCSARLVVVESDAARCAVATELGATIAGGQQVTSVADVGGEYEIGTAAGDTWRAERLIVTADAWTNEILANFGAHINLTVTQEQVAYYASAEVSCFRWKCRCSISFVMFFAFL